VKTRKKSVVLYTCSSTGNSTWL